MIDVQRAALVEAAKRVVRQRRQMNHGIEARKIVRDDIADILSNRRNHTAILAEIASRVEKAVEARDVVTLAHQHVDHHRPDVAAMARHQNLHLSSVCATVRGGRTAD